ncbi:MAG: hypothetical protein LW834_08410 [Cyanobium sp. 49614_E6]|nr:hypothetical protein [Cyanobium sp. 49614_E6]
MTAAPTRASFKPLNGPEANQSFAVHFNPTTLQISIANTLEDKGQGKEKKQYVTKSSAKLSMDLIYDSTHDGTDVRLQTGKIAKLMEPAKREGDNAAPPSVVLFEWGTFKFQGLVESYKETIDFFAPTGVPLRASINLTLASQDKVFESLSQGSDSKFEPLVQNLATSSESLTDVATQAGNPNAARAIAANNGLESIRFPAGAIALSAEIQLSPAAAFASGQAGLNAGFGISGGGNLAIGGQASAGIAASEGAFAGLRIAGSANGPPLRLDPTLLRATSASLNRCTGGNASFQVGGQAELESSSGLRADVGASASLQSRIQFT